MSSIFVSVANYRDPEAPSTVRSLLFNASAQHDVRIVVLTQGEAIEFPRWMPVEEVVIPAAQSEGCCWARAMIQTFYRGEDYHLQVDSHTQVCKDWDLQMIEDHTLGGPKSIITTYLAGYEFIKPGDPELPAEAYRHDAIRVTRWPRPSDLRVHTDHGIPSAIPSFTEPSETLSETLYYSGHWAFSAGEFVRDVPYDPSLFFHGEEITIAIRAYCAGYTLYVPRNWVASTCHARETQTTGPRSLFWDVEEDKVRQLDWWKRDQMSKIICQAICNGKWWGKFGIRDQTRYHELCQKMRDRFNVSLETVAYK